MRYLNSKKSGSNGYIIQHSFGIIFRKIEAFVLITLCVSLIITSKINSEFQRKVSHFFVAASLPMVHFVSFPFELLISFSDGLNDLILAKSENQYLKQELDNLRSFYISSINIRQENKELRKILNFVSSRAINFKVAKVIARTDSVFGNQLFLGVGKGDGIEEDMVAIGRYGVVGRVVEVFDSKSRLMLLTDNMSHIPVITSNSRIRGILVGEGSNNLMEIHYLLPNHGITVGDLVFTSGDGNSMPPGIFVGVVKKVDKNSAWVSPMDSIFNLDIVTLVHNEVSE